LVLDDPVQRIDDYRALHLTETLTAVRKSGFQVICTVEDAELGALLARRLRSTAEEAGLVVEMSYEAGSGGGIVRQRPSFPSRPKFYTLCVKVGGGMRATTSGNP
jgi:chromosome segregation protein